MSKLPRSARSCGVVFFWFLRWLTAFVLDWFFWKREGYLRAAGFGSLKDIVIRGFGCCATYCFPTGKKSHLTFDHLFQAEDRPLPSIFFTTCCFLGKKKKTTRKDFRPSFIAVLLYCSCSLFRVQMFMFGVQCMSRGCLHPFLPSFLVAPK